MERDFEANPYTPHEERVAKYLCEVTRIGAGDDPVEVLIASHVSLRETIKMLHDWINTIEGDRAAKIAATLERGKK